MEKPASTSPPKSRKPPTKAPLARGNISTAFVILIESVTAAIVELLKVRTIITLAIIGVMSHLAIEQAIKPETFMTVGSAVVTYYFTRKEQ